MTSSTWTRALIVVAGLQILGALAGFAFGDPYTSDAFAGAAIPPRWFVLPILVFASGGTLLLVMGRDDVRAARLGLFFLLLATPFTSRWLLVLAEWAPRPVALPAVVLRSLHVDSFFAWSFWLFAHEFPQAPTSRRVRRALAWGERVALLSGLALAGKELLAIALAVAMAPAGASAASIALDKPSYEHYWIPTLLTITALSVLLWRARKAVGAERRRVGLFVTALAIGLTPLFSQIALGAIPAYQRFLEQPVVLPVIVILTLVFFFTVPFTTAYAVLVHHVLNVKLLARRAIQYALARGTAIALIALPLAALIVYFYLRADLPLADLVSGNGWLLLALASAGALALYFRAPLLEAIDRRFFREQYNSRRILTVLVHDLRGVSDANDLAELICREMDRALHLESAAVLVEDPRSGTFTDPHTRSRRRLDASSPLARLVADTSEPLDTELEGRPSPVTRLPLDDRHWLAEHAVKLITPIPASDGTLLGMILLGAKKSGLPFLADDRQLLRDIANSAAMGIELSRIRREVVEQQATTKGDNGQPSATVATPPKTENARECPHCGRVYLSYTVFCTHCSRKLEPAQIPYVLPPNRFRFERRIGAGGMGVVYRASDLSLGRPVAIKTLRKVSPDHALRLRREARTAAAVVHPHLASIYGVDTWQTTPMLILELLEGGTLGQRIEKGVLPPLETVEIGIAMAGALERLHGADILHRDVKPNNIGFTREGVPKLMDFGIARMVLDSRTEPGPVSGSSDWMEVVDDQVVTWVWGVPGDPQTRSRQLVGTLSYLSPEALEGEPATASFDLWGLAVVLYECLIGRKLFRGDEIKQVMARIVMGRVPELTDVRPEAPEALGSFFRTALHRDIDRRPPTAAALRERLLAVKAELRG